MDTNENSLVYSRDVLEFATVAVQYCAFLESLDERDRKGLVDIMLKVLPLIYLKGELLPDVDASLVDDYSDTVAVTEENYNIVRGNLAYLMSDKDDYLDVFVEDMKYSDSPILESVSENLADIYQYVKNFAALYKDGTEEAMLYAIYSCKYEFCNSWGLKVLNVMRALHEVKYDIAEEDM